MKCFIRDCGTREAAKMIARSAGALMVMGTVYGSGAKKTSPMFFVCIFLSPFPVITGHERRPYANTHVLVSSDSVRDFCPICPASVRLRQTDQGAKTAP